MKVFIVIIGIFILALFLLIIRVIIKSRRIQAKIEEEVYQVLMDISHGGFYEDKLMSLAKRLDTRSCLYRCLYKEKKGWIDLFTDEYKNVEKIAESDLTVWLLHPNELGAVPDEIETVNIYERKEGSNGTSQYFLFKFRTFEPHWASKKGWVAGVAGPYIVGEEPLQSPACVFSRIEGFNTRTPEEHYEVMIQAVYNR